MRRHLLLVSIVVLVCSAQHCEAELLSFFEFDVVNEAAPGVILDSSGKGNHGVVRVPEGAVGNPSILDGGSGFSGDAADRSVSLESNGDIYLPTVNNGPDPGAFDSIIENQEMTVAFWVKAPAADAHQATFWGWLNPGRSSSIAPWNNNNIYWDTGGCCGGTQRLNGPVDPPDGEWHHWAFSRNEFGDKIIYLDGEFLYEGIEQNAELLGPSEGAPQEYAIGSELTDPNNPVRYVTAEFDDYAIWDEFLDEDTLEQLFTDGVRSVVSGLPDAPEQYVPAEQPTARLVNLDGQLGGAAFLDGDGIASWRVEEVFTTSAGGQQIEVVADLSPAGVAGDGNIGDANTNVALGDVPLINTGADDLTRTFRLVTSYPEPLLGLTSSIFEADITIPGSGGGSIDPFVLLGDLTQDGNINFSDFLIFSSNFGTTKEPIAPGTVPEPAAAWLLGWSGLLLGVMRRRR